MKNIVMASVVVLAVGPCWLGWTIDSRGADLDVGDHATDFTLLEFGTENRVSLYDFEGSIVLLDFFVYWCPHCATAASEIVPEIAAYYEQQRGNPDGIPVQLVALSLDNWDSASVASFIDQHQLPLVLDDGNGEVFSSYADGRIPHLTIVNGASGTNYSQWEILYSDPGYAAGGYADLRAVIDSVAVPEPSTGLLSLLGLLTLLMPRGPRPVIRRPRVS